MDGLLDGSLGFVGEESAGASFVRLDGSVWTTDKDGFIPALLSAEITSVMGKDPGEIYEKTLLRNSENRFMTVLKPPQHPTQKKLLSALSPQQVQITDMAGEKIESILTNAPGNKAPIGGLKISTKNGWFAARPSGTEDIYKIYGESFLGRDHLDIILKQAQEIVNNSIGGGSSICKKGLIMKLTIGTAHELISNMRAYFQVSSPKQKAILREEPLRAELFSSDQLNQIILAKRLPKHTF